MELTLTFVGNQLSGIHHQASKEALQAKGKLHLGLGTLEVYTRYEQLANKLTAEMNKNIDRVYCPTSISFSPDEAYLLEPLAVAYKLECAGHCHTWMQLPKTGNTAYYQDAWTKSVTEAEEMYKTIEEFLWDYQFLTLANEINAEKAGAKDCYISPFTGKTV